MSEKSLEISAGFERVKDLESKSLFKYFIFPFMIFMLLGFGVVQLNDPDALFWSLLYFYPAGLTVMYIKGLRKKYILSGSGVFYILIALYFYSGVSEHTIHDEFFRESLGLLIVGLWIGTLYAIHFSELKIKEN